MPSIAIAQLQHMGWMEDRPARTFTLRPASPAVEYVLRGRFIGSADAFRVRELAISFGHANEVLRMGMMGLDNPILVRDPQVIQLVSDLNRMLSADAASPDDDASDDA